MHRRTCVMLCIFVALGIAARGLSQEPHPDSTTPSRRRAVTFPPSPIITTYTTINGPTIQLLAFTGRHLAFLVPPTGCQHSTVYQMTGGLDAAWSYYASVTGRTPTLYKQFKGLGTIAVVDQTCGFGCGYLGYTGIEIVRGVFDNMCRDVALLNQWDQVPFYELGRNFWFYGDQLDYVKDDPAGTVTGNVTTGFAVLNRFLSMEAAGLNGSPFNGQPFAVFRARVEELVDLLAVDSSLNWSNTLRIGAAPKNPLNLGATDLFASHVLRLRRVHGEPFMNKLWRAAEKLPKAATTQQAVDNFVIAASRASGVNLVDVFRTTWKWPVSDSAAATLLRELGSPVGSAPYR